MTKPNKRAKTVEGYAVRSCVDCFEMFTPNHYRTSIELIHPDIPFDIDFERKGYVKVRVTITEIPTAKVSRKP